MRADGHLTKLRRAQRPLAAILLALFLLQVPLTALLTGRHASEMALAALFGDSICQPGQAADQPDQPKAPPGHSDCCLAVCFHHSGAAANVPATAVAVWPTPMPAARPVAIRHAAHSAPARFASDLSSRGPPQGAA